MNPDGPPLDPDELKNAWRTQAPAGLPPGADGPGTDAPFDPDAVLDEVRRRQRTFTTTLFWRDVREAGVGLVMIPAWIYIGVSKGLPWTWHLVVPALVWVTGVMLVDLRRQRRALNEPGESLRSRVEVSLAEVDRQIRLLRDILWWYLLPLGLSMLPFVIHVALRERLGVWWAVVPPVVLIGFGSAVFYFVYRLNQAAVRTTLEPRRAELAALLESLGGPESTADAAAAKE